MMCTQSAPSITRIFVSHMHGDHVYGLPGLLCNMAVAYGGEDGENTTKKPKDSPPIEIVGPPGLRSWIRAVLGNTYAQLGWMKLRVHELQLLTSGCDTATDSLRRRKPSGFRGGGQHGRLQLMASVRHVL